MVRTEVMQMQSLKILFDKDGKPKAVNIIRDKLEIFSESYRQVTRKIIDNSVNLDEKIFRENVSTLMPAFGMTRRGVFHGINSKSVVLDVCWKEFGKEFQDLKRDLRNYSSQRTRAILEVPNNVFDVTTDLFDRLEWTEIKGRNIGRVGASKILFSIFPEIALPVDNSEWDKVFRTHYYRKILQLMTDEIKLWEEKSEMPLEKLETNSPTTLPSIYNVMAMSARPKPRKNRQNKV
jgi:hypothetical protein